MVNLKIILFSLIVSLNLPLYAQEVTLQDLIGNLDSYSGKEVIVEGEVLDVLSRPDGKWINIVNNGVSIGIWADSSLDVPDINFYGSYTEQGDYIRVEGIFNSSCSQHLGQADIHANKISLTKRGEQIKETIDPADKHLVVFWGAIFLTLSLLVFLKRAREKKA